MTNHVARVTSLPQLIAPKTVEVAQPEPRNDNGDASRYRLTIEAIGRNRYVYKVLDRVTGKLIRQLPREDVEKLANDPTYRKGKVVDTSV